MHNFSIPSSLQLWTDHFVRNGRTFAYGAGGPKGPAGKMVRLPVACAGVYSPDTAAAAFNFVDPYLKTTLGLIGITAFARLPWKARRT